MAVLLGTDALTPPPSDLDIFGAQLEYLLRLATHPRLDIRLTPIVHAPDRPFTLTRTHNTTLAVIHTRRSTLWFHRREELDNLSRDIDRARASALSPDDTITHITDTLQRLRAENDHNTAYDLVRAG